MKVRFDFGKPTPWTDIDYPNERIFISKGKTNVLCERSYVVNRAKRLYPSDDD